MDIGSNLMLVFVFSTIGMGFLIYGRKQKKVVSIISGILLCVYTYFIHNITMIIFIGLILIFLPFFINE